ncbi:hypothetical protein AB4Y32_16220 [Paraburkholderia phymatum]|uniref:Uncharacterized protein n=1 Tax=Paraburkholderia phymatum TaxID=148447 RepID=A0ACC6U131_9BURK
MSETKHTPGPYLRTGTTVYALQHAGWRKGEEQFCNRIYANVQRGPDCSTEEAEAVACLFQAAPDLLEALQWVKDQGWLKYAQRLKQNVHFCDAVDRALAAIDKATGATND